MIHSGKPRPWLAVCPDCGRPVHRVPTGPSGELLLSVAAAENGGWMLRPHRCPVAGAIYPLKITLN